MVEIWITPKNYMPRIRVKSIGWLIKSVFLRETHDEKVIQFHKVLGRKDDDNERL